MILKKISLKNIRSFESQEIDFSDGSILLAGEIGSGKTSILMAIEYALFGLQPGQKGSSLLRNNADYGEVRFEFELSGKTVVIERRIKRGSKSITNDYASITLDGEKFESSLTEVKSRILSLIGYPAEFLKKNNLLYRYTVYTPQESMKNIVLEDPEVRLNVLRYVLGIEKYKRIRENSQILLNYLKDSSRVLQLEVRDLEKEKENKKQLLDSIARLLDEIQKEKLDVYELIKTREIIETQTSELEVHIRTKEKFQSEIEKTNIHLMSKKEILSSYARELNELTETLSRQKEEFDNNILTKTVEEIEKTKSELEAFNGEMISILSMINSLFSDRGEKEKKKERIFSIQFCPTCLQDVPDFHKANIFNTVEKEIRVISGQLEELLKRKSELESRISIKKSSLSALEEKRRNLLYVKSKQEFLQASRNKIDEISKNKLSLEKDVSLLEKHRESLREEILSLTRYDILSKSKKEELRLHLEKEKSKEIIIARKEKELELIDITSKEIDVKIANMESKRQTLSYIMELIDWVSNYFLELVNFTERNIMIKLRNEFSSIFSRWFNMLVSEGLDVRVDENFTPIITQGEIEMEYSFLSGGERTAVALAYRLALNQIINSIMSTIKTSSLLILDEPTEGFSEVQIARIRDILQELNIPQIIIVSHEQKIEGFVENIIKIKKEGSSSRISLENP